jgi:hypothetical protein
MASQTIPSRPFARSVESVNRLFPRVTVRLAQCSWCSPESAPGACDGGDPCQNFATVHDLEDDQGYCRRHFFNRGGVR